MLLLISKNDYACPPLSEVISLLEHPMLQNINDSLIEWTLHYSFNLLYFSK